MPILAAALSWIVFLLALPVLLLHPRVRQGVRRRLGLYDGDPLAGARPRVWLHGASAGDIAITGRGTLRGLVP